LFFTRGWLQIFRYKATPWTHSLRLKIGRLKIQNEKSGKLTRQMKRRRCAMAGITKLCQGPSRIDA